jgi:hypothetical protein
MTQPWVERIWRNGYGADVARGLVPNAISYAAFGDIVTSGPIETVLWETGMPATLTVPNNIRLSVVSASAGETKRIKIRYLDGNLVQRTETVTLNGTTPVLTVATDIRAVNNAYSLDGPLTGRVTMTNNGNIHATIPAGAVQFNTSLQRVPAGKRLMVTGLYAGSTSGTAAARATVKLETSTVNGDDFSEQGWLHPVAGIAFQDTSIAMSLPAPLAVNAGAWVGLIGSCDKAATLIGGIIGWTEEA